MEEVGEGVAAKDADAIQCPGGATGDREGGGRGGGRRRQGAGLARGPRPQGGREIGPGPIFEGVGGGTWLLAARTLAGVRPVAVTETRLCRDCGRTTLWCSGRMRDAGGMPLRHACIW